MMKKFGLLMFMIAFVLVAAVGFSGGAWYEGGNLHRKTVRSWKNASYSNKLATAADWALTSPKVKRIVKNSSSINTLKPFAKELVSCVDEASSGTGYEKQDVSGVAASCMVLMGW